MAIVSVTSVRACRSNSCVLCDTQCSPGQSAAQFGRVFQINKLQSQIIK